MGDENKITPTDEMTPDQVIRILKDYGIKITKRTLFNYEKMNLIPTPLRKGQGRGIGYLTQYPKDTIAEGYAAYNMRHNGTACNYTFEAIAIAREYALFVKDNIKLSDEDLSLKLFEKERAEGKSSILASSWNVWLMEVEEIDSVIFKHDNLGENWGRYLRINNMVNHLRNSKVMEFIEIMKIVSSSPEFLMELGCEVMKCDFDFSPLLAVLKQTIRHS